MTPGYSIYQLAEPAIISATGGTPRVLAPGYDHWTGASVLAPDAHGILTEVQEDRNNFVGYIPLDGKLGVRRVTKATGSASGLNAAAGHVAMLWSTDATAAEIYALENGTPRKLTGHNDALIASLTIAPVEELSAKTS